VQRGDRRLGRPLGGDVDKAIAQAPAVLGVAGDAGAQDDPIGVEGFRQPLIAEIRRQIADEDVAA